MSYETRAEDRGQSTTLMLSFLQTAIPKQTRAQLRRPHIVAEWTWDTHEQGHMGTRSEKSFPSKTKVSQQCG